MRPVPGACHPCGDAEPGARRFAPSGAGSEPSQQARNRRLEVSARELPRPRAGGPRAARAQEHGAKADSEPEPAPVGAKGPVPGQDRSRRRGICCSDPRAGGCPHRPRVCAFGGINKTPGNCNVWKHRQKEYCRWGGILSRSNFVTVSASPVWEA